MISKELKDLYQQMSDHTKGECGSARCAPFKVGGCCNQTQCWVVAMACIELYGMEVDLIKLSISKECFDFRGQSGCVLEPWQRPVCTMHTCEINNLGFKVGGEGWTTEYFRLREEISARLEEEGL